MVRIIMIATLLWSTSALSYNFGVQGRSGYDGRSGQDGANGQDISVVADGRPVQLDLRGGDGTDGMDGDQGGDAFSCYQRRGMDNEYGAAGGDGGDAGRGGNGGDGGDATFFFNDHSELKNIYLDNSGGRAAVAGRAGYGGRGCHCSFYNWTHRICRTENQCTIRRVCDPNGQNCRDIRECRPVQVCRNANFSCFDGRSGRNGVSASSGSNGTYGSLKLVPGRTDIPSHNPSAELTFSQLADYNYTLTKRIWREKNDGHALFAPGSRISGHYSEFVELRPHVVALKWEANRPLSDFAESRLGMTFDGHSVELDWPEDILVKYELRVVAGGSEIVVKEIYTAKEVSDLKIASTTSYGNNLAVKVSDGAQLSDRIKNEVKLEWVHRKWRIWYVVYDKLVPEEFLSITPDGIEVQVGKIGIPSAYIARGKLIRYTLWIKRSLGNNFTEVKLHQPAMNLR